MGDTSGFSKVSSFLKKVLAANNKILAGSTMLIATALIVVISRFLITYNPLRPGKFDMDLPPSPENILGTDSLGRDVFAQLMVAIVNSSEIGLIAASVGLILGTVMGFVAGYFKDSIIDMALRFIMDVFLVLPMLPMLILFASFLKRVGIVEMALILSIFSWSGAARTIRSQVLSLRERGFVNVAKITGMGSLEIIWRELMPNMLQYLSAILINTFLWAILAEVGLELLGLGPQYTMTLGMLIYWALIHQALFRGLYWWWFSPAGTIVIFLVSLFLVHLGIDEVVNPRLREKVE